MADFDLSNIHGFNPLFQTGIATAPQFQCFAMEDKGARKGISEFKFQKRAILNGNAILDHQGHIIPQNILTAPLINIAKAAFEEKITNLDSLGKFLDDNYGGFDFKFVTAYIKNVLIKNGATEEWFIEEDAKEPLERYRGYFSVVVWNPVNICRAPEDHHRQGGAPGDKVDEEVLCFLKKNTTQLGLPDGFVEKANSAKADIPGFIAYCNSTLETMKTTPLGYYAFEWVENKNEKLEIKS